MKARTSGRAFTPLHLAALGGKTAAVNTLLLARADVNPYGKANTPLYLALKHDHLGVAESLLTAGADGSIQSMQGAYPIHLAACGGYDGIVTELLQNGATWNCLDAKGKTPLRLAALADRVSTVKLLVTGGGKESSNNPLTLRTAAYSDDTVIIPALVKGGLDVEARSAQDLTPLLSAAYLGARSAVRALLQAGADVNTTTIDGSTPLHAVCCRGDYRMANLLLKWGADPIAADNRGKTPSKWMPNPAQVSSRTKRQELIDPSELLLAAASRSRRERAWRRRRYLVMCHAYPSRWRILLDASRTSDAYWQPPRRSNSRVSSGADVRTEVEDANEGQAGGGERGGTKTGDGFGGVMAWLMELKNEDEGAFRSIIGFL